jgi:FMN phosphatase YigB (HAD superfamily)
MISLVFNEKRHDSSVWYARWVIRAIFFDFYGVWTPDVFAEHLAEAQQFGPAVVGELQDTVNRYFQGEIGPEQVADAFRFKLSRPDIDTAQFTLRENDIFPAIVDFMRGLHGHFVKLGILANLGRQEFKVLNDFNQQNQVFETIVSPLSLQLPSPLLSNEVFDAALRAIGEPTRSCMVITGNPAYLQFAQNLGIGTLAYQGFPKLQQDLQQVLSQTTEN